jgi:hypothetical protein
MSLYAIAFTESTGRPRGWYMKADGHGAPEPGAARKFTTVADARVFAEAAGEVDQVEGDPVYYAVLGILPAVLAAAEAAAQHDWNHRDCHAGNGRAA